MLIKIQLTGPSEPLHAFSTTNSHIVPKPSPLGAWPLEQQQTEAEECQHEHLRLRLLLNFELHIKEDQ